MQECCIFVADGAAERADACKGSRASAADDMQRRSRASAQAGRWAERAKTFPKIFQKMPFKSLWNHKNTHKQRDCGQCGRTMVEQSDPSHLYIYASCVYVRARRGMWYGRHAGWSADSSGAQPGIAARRHIGAGRQACPRPPGALTTAARYSNITHTRGD